MTQDSAPVVIVDGDPKSRHILATCLQKAGYTVVDFPSAEDALAKLEELRPGLIISEVDLPGMNGLSLLEAIKLHPSAGQVPFVFLTREQSRLTRYRGLERGAVEYMAKPVIVKELLLRLRAVFDKASQESALLQELQHARHLQEGFVGPRDLIRRGPLSVAGHYVPAGICGGDLWNIFDVDEDSALIVIGDVTGHGVPSALITATAHSCCDTLMATSGSSLSVATLLRTLNQVTSRVAQGKLCMTCFVSQFDLKARRMTYANASHPTPFFLRPIDGVYQPVPLPRRGNPLGDQPDASYEEETIDILDGDVILWFTDGLTEGRNESGTPWGERRLLHAARAALPGAPEALRDAIIQEAMAFFGARPADDDITLVVGQIS